MDVVQCYICSIIYYHLTARCNRKQFKINNIVRELAPNLPNTGSKTLHSNALTGFLINLGWVLDFGP